MVEAAPLLLGLRPALAAPTATAALWVEEEAAEEVVEGELRSAGIVNVARIPNEVEEAAETDDDDTELDATELEDDAPAKQEVSLLAPTVMV